MAAISRMRGPGQPLRLPGALGEEVQGQEQQGGDEEQAREGEQRGQARVWGRGSFHPDTLAALQGAMASAQCPLFSTRGSGLAAAPNRMSPRSLKLNYKVSGVPSPRRLPLTQAHRLAPPPAPLAGTLPRERERIRISPDGSVEAWRRGVSFLSQQ